MSRTILFIWLIFHGISSSIGSLKRLLVAETITSPNNSDANRFVYYQMKVDGGVIRLEFDHIQFSATGEDFLLIFDGEGCLKHRQAVIRAPNSWPIYSSSEYMGVLFVTGRESSESNFSGYVRGITNHRTHSTYRKLAPPKMDNLLEKCLQIIGDESGMITFPSEAEKEQLCIWKFTGRTTRVDVELTLNQTITGANWIRILDGPECTAETKRFLNRDSQETTTKLISASGNLIVIAYRAPGSYMGFSLAYKKYDSLTYATEPVRSSVRNRGIDSPNLLTVNFTTALQPEIGFEEKVINVPENMRIKLRFSGLSLRDTNAFIAVFDGASCIANPLFALDDKNVVPFAVTRTNVVTALFVSPNPSESQMTQIFYDKIRQYVPFTGGLLEMDKFTATDMLLHPVFCGEAELREGGILRIPPVTSEKYLCIWHVSRNPGVQVLLKVDLQESLKGSSWLRIIDGNDCNGERLLHIDDRSSVLRYEAETTSEHAIILFYQHRSQERKGRVYIDHRRESYKTCHRRYLPAAEGSVLSPNYPMDISEGSYCNLKIETPPNTQVEFEIQNIKLSMDDGDLLMFFDGTDCLSRRMAILRRSQDLLIQSSGDRLSALLISGYGTHERYYFGRYRAVRNTQTTMAPINPNASFMTQCGQDHFQNNQHIFIHIPHTAGALCIWRINAPKITDKIKLVVSQSTAFTGASFLRILDGPDCASRSLVLLNKNNYFPKTEKNTENYRAMVIIYADEKSNGVSPVSLQYSFIQSGD